MLITSTRLSPPKPAQREVHPAGVILGVPEMQVDSGGTLQTIAEGMYVFPADPNAANPLGKKITSIAKSLSIQLAAQLHPHLETAARGGWVLAGAYSLLARAKHRKLSWCEIVVDGGLLAAESFVAVSDALPESYQLKTDWCEGTACLLDAAQHVADGGNASHFLMGQALDQSPPIGQLRTLLSLTLAAQHRNSPLSGISANKIDVTVQSTRQTLPDFLAPDVSAKRKSA